MHDVYFAPGVERLLTAAFAPDVQAKEAFQRWVRTCDFETLPWEEMRLLPLVCEQIERLEPPASLRPRLVGVAKQVWTRSQLLVSESAQALDLLAAAEVPTMLIKGAALIAEGVPLARRRIVGDVDVLVPPADFDRALDALLAGGWRSARGLSEIFLRQVAHRRAGINLVHSERGKVDLHHVPLHFSRLDAKLEKSVWAGARRATLAGRTVAIPDPADMLVFTLGHSAGSVSGDWVVEFILRLRDPAFDWSRFALRTRAYGLAALLKPRLGWLEHRLWLDCAAARTGTTVARATLPERLKARAVARPKPQRGILEHALGLVADLWLGRGYSLERKRDDDVRPLRPRVRPVARTDMPLRDRHNVARTANDPPRVSLVFPCPSFRRKAMFEVIFDGHVSRLLRGRVVPNEAGWIEWTFNLPRELRHCAQIEIVAVALVSLDKEASSEQKSFAQPIDFALADVNMT